MVTSLSGQNWGTIRCTWGFQMAVATPTKMTRRPRVTISERTVDAPCRRRMKTTSTTMASSGARIKSTRAKERTGFQPHPCQSCQKLKAAIMPTAPWAKLKIPVVV